MNEQTSLIFKLNHSHYDIPEIAVQKLFFLPEVTENAAICITARRVVKLSETTQSEQVTIQTMNEWIYGLSRMVRNGGIAPLNCPVLDY